MAMPPDDPPPGVPEWIVTYGDMMSLLLTFFIMLVSMSEMKADKKYRAVLEAVQSQLGYRSSPVSPPGESFALNSLQQRLQILGARLNSRESGGIKAKETLPGKDSRVLMTRPGKPISAGPPVRFGVNSSSLTAAEREHIQRLATEVAGKPNKLELRAHCSPRSFERPDELDRLCYARARQVLDELLAQGIGRERLRITLLRDSETMTLEDAQSLTRDRVDVVLLDALTQDFVGPRE